MLQSPSVSDVLNLVQHHLAADSECSVLVALSRARSEFGATAPGGAHFYLIKALDYRPVTDWERADGDRAQLEKLEMVEEALRLAQEAGE